jgi:hypothetical protein
MPYPNEHSARLRDPGDFDPKTFRRTNGGTLFGRIKVPVTIGVIWGKLKGSAKPSDPPLVQALRFPTKNWTAAAARKWLKDNNVKAIAFEEAKKEEQSDEQAAGGTTERRPAEAFCLSAELEFSEGAGDEGEIPIRVVARTAKPVEHPCWGRIVHDLAGMRVKPTIPLDYVHDAREVIGYLDSFERDNTRGLVCAGALVPFGEDRAAEVAHKGQRGVPYQASIYFGGPGVKIQEIGVGEKAEVNGYSLDGPAVIVRKWPLSGVAICPHGADRGTVVRFSDDQDGEVEFLLERRNGMAKAKEPVEPIEPEELATAEPIAAEVALQAPPIAQSAIPATLAAEIPAAPAVPAAQPQAAIAAPGQRFLDAFGEKGGVWFAQGKTWEEAYALYLVDLKAQVAAKEQENAALKAKLAALTPGEPAPVSATPAEDAETQAVRNLSAKIGPNLARVAAGIRFARAKESK